jgi:hypothetical protein
MALPKAGKDGISETSRYHCNKYRVGMILEYYKELTIMAADEKEARHLAEVRVRSRQVRMLGAGYSLGDIEPILVEEIKQ